MNTPPLTANQGHSSSTVVNMNTVASRADSTQNPPQQNPVPPETPSLESTLVAFRMSGLQATGSGGAALALYHYFPPTSY